MSEANAEARALIPEPEGQAPAATLSDITPMLAGSLLFKGASEVALAHIASTLEPVHFKKGDPIILQNETGDHVYFVRSGSVEIVRYDAELRQLQRLALLKPGQQFSEFSLLTHERKSASAFAFENSQLLRMNGETFLSVLNKFPIIARQMVQQLAELEKDLLATRVHVPIFHASLIKLTPQLSRLMPPETWKRFSALPLAFDGHIFSVALHDPYNAQVHNHLRSMVPSALIEVYRISEDDLHTHQTSLMARLAKGASRLKDNAAASEGVGQTIEKWLESAEPFCRLPPEVWPQLLPVLNKEVFEAGQFIFKAQTPSEHFYLIASGQAKMHRELPGATARTLIATFNPGDTFPETSLIMETPHFLSVVATQPTVVYALPKAVFAQLLESPDFCLGLARSMARTLQASHYGGIAGRTISAETSDMQPYFELLPRSVMQAEKVLPLKVVENELILGAVDLSSETVYTAVSRYLLNYRVQFQQIKDSDFQRWYSQLEKSATAKEAEREPEAQGPIDTKNTVGVVDKIIAEGVRRRASDIHFEPFEKHFVLRYRIDGVLREYEEKLPVDLGKEIINRIKILSQLDITQHHTPQDGQLKIMLNDKPQTARVSVLPTKFGENAVLRLIRSESSVIPLDALAPDRYMISTLRAISRLKQGLFLVTGPTGSGKSTSLYSMLSALNRVDVNVISLEDPVEMEIAGLTQVQIHEKAGLTFGRALRSVLRQDPDVVMVGEIRDAESAKIVFEAAITGHLVISTLHTTSSLDIIQRLRELGVSAGVISAGLVGAMAQRLVRAICSHCAVEYKPTEEERELFEQTLGAEHIPHVLRKGEGCAHCFGIGYHGRVPIFEIWRKNQNIGLILSEEAPLLTFIEAVRRSGFCTLFEFGLKMAKHGLTTVDEVQRVLPRFEK
jgi:type IV pilus assembly protein PilB